MAFLTVGSGQQYATLSAAVAASHDGDTVYIQAGTYLNDTAIINTKINLVGVGGMAHFVADRPIANGKGFLVTNTDVSVDHLEFSGATVPSGNGAGIRAQSGHLTVTNSYFHGNEDGILSGNIAGSVVTIDHSEFGPNVAASGHVTHNVYIGHIATLQITNSYMHDAVTGHELKSRAQTSIIQDNRIFDNNSAASLSIDLPNSGNATIQNNIIQQGPNSPNGGMISYAAEIASTPQWASSSLLVDGNTIINQRAGFAVGVDNRNPAVTAHITNNAFYGLKPAQIAAGNNVQSGDIFLGSAPSLDTSHPWGNSPWDALVSGGASADVLHGSAANDLFVGGGANDTFVVSQGADNIADFSHTQADRIDLTALSAFHGLADVQAHATQNGADTLIDLGNGNTLTLQAVAVGSLAAADFLFGSSSSSADLTASNFVVSPGNVSFTINNSGTAAAGASAAGVYLSADSTITTADTLLAAVSTPSLAAGGTDPESASLVLPGNLTPGTYYLGALSDYAGQIAESNEANNASAAVPVILGNSANNGLTGTSAADMMFGFAGNDTLNGGLGADTMSGGLGNDVYFVDNAGDAVIENTGEGTDTVKTTLSSYALPSNVENLNYTGAGSFTGVGNGLANTINGGAHTDTLSGADGNDLIRGYAGNDTLSGDIGNDSLDGGAGFDIVTGGVGADYFVFTPDDLTTGPALGEITDFSHGQADRIDLSRIDAIAGGVNDPFSFIGNGAFTGAAGQLHYVVNGSGGVNVEGDLNGDGVADFIIAVDGVASLVGADFVL